MLNRKSLTLSIHIDVVVLVVFFGNALGFLSAYATLLIMVTLS